MISPALTTWPPQRFTPRRWAFESRPLRDDEAPFLCAMSRSALRDVADHDAGQGLTVPLPLLVAGVVPELVDVDLRPLGVSRISPVTVTLARAAASLVTVSPSTRRIAG